MSLRISLLKPSRVRWLREAGTGSKGNYSAKKGQTIRGRLMRGAGGRFSSTDEKIASGEIPPEQTGLSAEQSDAFLAMQRGDALTPAQAEVLAAAGLATIGATGARLTAAGTRAAKALKRGDIAALKRQVQAAAEWKAYLDKRKAAKGGGSGKQSAADKKAAREAEKKRASMTALATLGFDDTESAALYQYANESSGIEYDSNLADRFVTAGILERNEDTREIYASTEGRALMRAIKSGDVATAREALKRARAAKAEADDAKLKRDVTTIEHEQEESNMAHKRGIVASARIVAQPKTNTNTPAAAQPVIGERLPLVENGEAGELVEGAYEDVYPWGETSFSQLESRIAASESAETIQEMARLLPGFIGNIMTNVNVPDKVAAVRSLMDEFAQRVESAIAAIEAGQVSEADVEEFADAEVSNGGAIVGLSESDAAGGPLTIRAVIIRPGAGNARDNHYYPAAVLERDGRVFVGAKMYESEHGADKTTRNWVSTIEAVEGVTDKGLIGRVVVHDPNFAARLRNLNASGLIESMECSILASGTARKGKVDGGEYNVVESISRASSVDWVTKAGAGGHALPFAESAAEPTDTEDGKPKEDTIAKPPTGLKAIAESGEALPVIIRESQPGDDAGSASDGTAAPAAAASAEPPKDTQPVDGESAAASPAENAESGAPTALTESEVANVLKNSRLPAAVVARLAGTSYASAEALREAISNERAYLAEVFRAGQPFDFSERAQTAPARSETKQERDARIARISAKYSGRA